MRKSIVWQLTGLVLLGVTLAGCETTSVQEGAVAGGLLGAGAGAIIGHQSGHKGNGALIGAAAGALTGALIGDQVDQRAKRGQVAPAPAPTHVAAPSYTQPAQTGHYENRVVRTPAGESYEERVWVPDR